MINVGFLVLLFLGGKLFFDFLDRKLVWDDFNICELIVILPDEIIEIDLILDGHNIVFYVLELHFILGRFEAEHFFDYFLEILDLLEFINE